jgi:hypothetical protein
MSWLDKEICLVCHQTVKTELKPVPQDLVEGESLFVHLSQIGQGDSQMAVDW